MGVCLRAPKLGMGTERWMLLRPFQIGIGLGLNWGVAAYEEDLEC